MVRVRIKWSTNCGWLSNANTSNLKYLDDNGFYAIYLARYNSQTIMVGDGKLLYIGKAYDQTIRQRLQQHHDADQCINNLKRQKTNYELFFKSGIISETDQERLTVQLVNDIECCMIFMNKPSCNIQCKEKYDGREVSIENENSWIIKNSSCP